MSDFATPWTAAHQAPPSRADKHSLPRGRERTSVEAAVQHRRLGSVLRRNDGWGGAEGEGGLFSSLLGSSEDELSLYTFISPVPGLKISKSQTNSEALEKYLLC